MISSTFITLRFPSIIIVLALANLAGPSAGFSNLGSGNNSSSGSDYSIRFFGDFPVLLQYNWGLGTRNGSEYRFGWFVGGGATYTITGVSFNSSGHGTSEKFSAEWAKSASASPAIKN